MTSARAARPATADDGAAAELRRGLEAACGVVTGAAPAGIGVDAEEIGRWLTMPDRMAQLFSSDEIAYCRAQGVPAQHFAGTWCAKEAVVKAVSGTRSIHVRDVQIGHLPDGRPTASVNGLALSPGDLVVSVTHTRTMAAAVALYRPDS